jgi:hypothetical protein
MYDDSTIIIMFPSISSSTTKFAKYNRTCNHKTKDIALNKNTEFAEQHNSILYSKISNLNYFTPTD